jgi:hypothetical protein
LIKEILHHEQHVLYNIKIIEIGSVCHKKLSLYIQPPYAFSAKNTLELTHDLNNVSINQNWEIFFLKQDHPTLEQITGRSVRKSPIQTNHLQKEGKESDN